jgi:hypothetical protein
MEEYQMIKLSSIIKRFGNKLQDKYQNKLLPSHRNALDAMKKCRTHLSLKMLAGCTECDEKIYVPHSCDHRNCPHCQNHESQQWLERQLKKQVYAAMIQSRWDTLREFSENDKALKGTPGAIGVMHTHSRRLDFHPHVHVVIPAAVIEKKAQLWRTKTSENGKPFLFKHKALAKVFRAKMLEAITAGGLTLPKKYPQEWVVDCKHVGSGEKALVYLGRYLYRGVLQEKDIMSVHNGEVTFRYQDSDTKKMALRTLPGEDFLWLLLRHILPRGFRRARNFGFLHPNSKRLIQVLQLICKLDWKRALGWMKKRRPMHCRCGGVMEILKTRIPSVFTHDRWDPARMRHII